MNAGHCERTVDSTTVGNETKPGNFVHKVLKGSIYNVEQLRFQKTLNDPEAVPVILFPESTSGYDKGVIERDESALAGNAITQSGRVRPANQLRPESMDSLSKSLDEGVSHIVEEGGRCREVLQSLALEFQTFASEEVVDKVYNILFCRVGRNLGKCIHDGLRRCIGRFVHERLWISIDRRDVYCL